MLRFRSIRIFLERDTVSNLLGIQTCPGISRIQLSVTTSTSAQKCRAWITKAEFSPDEIVPYSLEHDERIPLKWSKHGGAVPYETDLHSGDSPVRMNIAIFIAGRLEIDGGTPTKWLPLLQRTGFHRLAIRVTRKVRVCRISENRRIVINWRGNAGATVRMVPSRFHGIRRILRAWLTQKRAT
jgi:hypothetical protein